MSGLGGGCRLNDYSCLRRNCQLGVLSHDCWGALGWLSGVGLAIGIILGGGQRDVEAGAEFSKD